MVRTAVNISRVLVGLLFIFSGLVKANDPLGLSYKMQEFFELWGMARFNSWTLLLSVLMNAFEIIAGFALLLGWRIRLFSWLLLLMIIFFTFLTGYAYLSGKFRNCGCFGDCIPITPKISFLKDIILLVLISLLFWKRNLLRPLLRERVNTLIMAVVTALAFGIQWYTLTYLPIADCLPFRKGNHIPQQMRIPEGARPDSFAIRFVYEKDGKQYEFSATDLPADLGSYKFISRVDKLIRKGNAEPPLKGFNLTGKTKSDSTQAVMQLPYAILLFCEDFKDPVSGWSDEFEKVYAEAMQRNIPAWIVTTQPGQAEKELKGTAFASIPVFSCDYTALRTAARTNPCLYIFREGTVLGKWSRPDFGDAMDELQKIK
jgi:uncharacterized membrane protein YphA (DoxX/SURF4 family)